MKNLENYGVLELNAKEIRKIDGGFWNIVAIVITIGIAVDYIAGEFMEGWNNPK